MKVLQGPSGSQQSALKSGSTLLPLILLFFSGFLGLVYEVLWIRELGLLFGNSTHAAATALAVFFLGLSVGSYLWGRKAQSLRAPLKTYAVLELGIAVSALLYFLLLDLYRVLYSPIFLLVGESQGLMLLAKVLLSAGVLFLPAFFMGGTLPVMADHLIHRVNQLGKTGSLLYTVNTSGAAFGAFAAGFYLPVVLGFENSYLLAIAGNVLIAGVAYRYNQGQFLPAGPEAPEEADLRAGPEAPSKAQVVALLAFASGFTALALEVLWTRMFVQVLHNSVYSFSAILTSFLIALALGSALANVLCRLNLNPRFTQSVLLSLAGVLVALSPLLFYQLTDGLKYLASEAGWYDYVGAIFQSAAIVILLPGALVGSVFPYLLKMAQGTARSASRIVGNLIASNVIGAIAGSLFAGFFLISSVGLWGSLRFIALLYLLLAIGVVYGNSKQAWIFRAIPALGIVLLMTLFDPQALSLVRVNPDGNERLVEVWEGSSGTVAVIERNGSLRIKVNNYYTLGGSASSQHEEYQAHIPLLIHPDPKSVFFLGMGTGITAGAALDHPVHRVVVCELMPEVILSSRKHFSRYTNGLFEDERAQILTEDGRSYLQGTREQFDIIVADLFFPWRRSAGFLYTREHFLNVKSHLKEGGIFAQWLPLYQLSEEEFFVIARTMQEVFPQITIWRGDFRTTQPIAALIAQSEPRVLDSKSLSQNARFLRQSKAEADRERLAGLPLYFYAGNLSQSPKTSTDYPVNTDDRPLIEYSAPITHREESIGQRVWFTSDALVDFFNQLAFQGAPAEDPYLGQLTSEQLEYVVAGWSFYRAAAHRRAGRLEEAERSAREFLKRVPIQISLESEEEEVHADFQD